MRNSSGRIVGLEEGIKPRTRVGKERVATSILWVPLLLGLAAVVVVTHVARGEAPAIEAILAATVLAAGALVAEWPRRSREVRRHLAPLRWAVVGICLWWLFVALQINGPIRDAAVTQDRLTQWGGSEATEYMSGVLTMAEAMSAGTSEAWLPIAVLVVLIVVREYREATE